MNAFFRILEDTSQSEILRESKETVIAQMVTIFSKELSPLAPYLQQHLKPKDIISQTVSKPCGSPFLHH